MTLSLHLGTEFTCKAQFYFLQDFAEKPKGEALEKMKVDTTILGALFPPWQATRLAKMLVCNLEEENDVAHIPSADSSTSVNVLLRSSAFFQVSKRCLGLTGLSAAEAQSKPFIASMGIYVFKKDQLVKLLKETYIQSNDFGGEIIPAAAADHKVVAYLFNDYWEDIGTIKSFFEANLALAQHVSNQTF